MTSSFIFQTARGFPTDDNPSGQPVGCVERYAAIDSPDPDDGLIDYRFAYIVGPGNVSGTGAPGVDYAVTQVTNEPDAADVRFAWTAPTTPGDATVTFDDSDGQSTNAQFSAAGDYVIQCVVSSNGNTNPANRTLQFNVTVTA